MKPTAWQTSLLEHLSALDQPDARAAVEFIRTRRIRIGFKRRSPAVGALWYIDGNIYLNSRHFTPLSAFDNPRLLCLVVHEARHLQQGWLKALSVYGELEAWQVDFRLYQALTAVPLRGPLAELLALPVVLDREVLMRARTLMQAYAGRRYRIDLLPLYPLPSELRCRLRALFGRPQAA